jgi:hypothetical protein
MSKLHVVLVGSVIGGFAARAILPQQEANALVEELRGKAGDYVVAAPVTEPKEMMSVEVDPNGDFLTVFGDIETGFKFVGPFGSDPEADEYGHDNTGEIDDHSVYTVIAVSD